MSRKQINAILEGLQMIQEASKDGILRFDLASYHHSISRITPNIAFSTNNSEYDAKVLRKLKSSLKSSLDRAFNYDFKVKRTEVNINIKEKSGKVTLEVGFKKSSKVDPITQNQFFDDFRKFILRVHHQIKEIETGLGGFNKLNAKKLKEELIALNIGDNPFVSTTFDLKSFKGLKYLQVTSLIGICNDIISDGHIDNRVPPTGVILDIMVAYKLFK